jgi:putative ABC transport system substrate-binding protein
MTGVSDAVNYEANIDLIQELFPSASSIGMVYNPGERNSQFGVERTREILDSRQLTLTATTVSGSGEVGDAARSLVGRVDVIYVGSDNTVVSALEALLSVARESRLPVIASDAGSVEKGALAAVSVDYERVGRAAGYLVADVLDRRIAPGELEPVVVRGDALILNLASSKKLGIAVPEEVRSRAVRTIP